MSASISFWFIPLRAKFVCYISSVSGCPDSNRGPLRPERSALNRTALHPELYFHFICQKINPRMVSSGVEPGTFPTRRDALNRTAFIPVYRGYSPFVKYQTSVILQFFPIDCNSKYGSSRGIQNREDLPQVMNDIIRFRSGTGLFGAGIPNNCTTGAGCSLNTGDRIFNDNSLTRIGF